MKRTVSIEEGTLSMSRGMREDILEYIKANDIQLQDPKRISRDDALAWYLEWNGVTGYTKDIQLLFDLEDERQSFITSMVNEMFRHKPVYDALVLLAFDQYADAELGGDITYVSDIVTRFASDMVEEALK